MFGLDAELLTRTGDIVEQLKEHFKNVLKTSTMSTFEETEPEDSVEDKTITIAKNMVVKKLLCGRMLSMMRFALIC